MLFDAEMGRADSKTFKYASKLLKYIYYRFEIHFTDYTFDKMLANSAIIL